MNDCRHTQFLLQQGVKLFRETSEAQSFFFLFDNKYCVALLFCCCCECLAFSDQTPLQGILQQYAAPLTTIIFQNSRNAR